MSLDSEKIQSKHTLSYCALCDSDIVICANCVNNCCNGGTGELPDGSRCGCDEAYAHQTAHYIHPDQIQFTRDIRLTAPKKLSTDRRWNDVEGEPN